MWLFAPLLLFHRRQWVRVVFPGLLLLGAGIWAETAWLNLHQRLVHGEPWLRMVIILGGVGLFTAASALVFTSQTYRVRFQTGMESWKPSTITFALTGLLMGVVQVKVAPPALLLERFLPGGGWLTIFWLSVYAAWIAEKLMDPKLSAIWRSRIWGLFSLVFFAQLALGLLGQEKFLMTGNLHLPVPAVIVAGPLYRGHGLFMPILFGITLLLTGPAWCSHLCYIGAWDDKASRLGGRPQTLPRWRRRLRPAIMLAVIAMALGLRSAAVPASYAALLALAFGLTGVVVMLTWSRKTGTMTHCTAYCPLGWVATRLGKLSPFRIRIDHGCTECGACSKACRYDALSGEDIKNRRPGESCTLCGDCVGRCQKEQIGFRFLGLEPARARTMFVILIVSLHAVFMGVARM
jgi:ferredoxin